MPKKQRVDLAFTFDLEPKAAMKYFRSKGYTLSWDWHETLGEAHAAAFTVAHVARMDILQDIRGAVDEAIKGGQTFEEFKQGLEPTLKKKGWWGRNKRINPETGEEESILEGSPHRLRTIYQTNMKSAYNAGREEFFQKNKKNRPYAQFVTVVDNKRRESHARLHGKVFHLDDPFWDRFTPPLDFNCRCRKRALSKRQIKRKGLKILSSKGKMVREDRLVSKKTGEARPVWGYKLPGGGKMFPQVGFDHNQWKAAFQPDLDKYDYDIARKYVEGTVTGPGFKRFVAGETGGKMPVGVLPPEIKNKMGAKSQSILLSEETRNTHRRITLKQYQNVQKIVESVDPVYLPRNRAAYVFEEDGKLRRMIVKTTRDKKETYFLSLHNTRKSTVEKMKKKEIKR